jgi:hypothetical protein
MVGKPAVYMAIPPSAHPGVSVTAFPEALVGISGFSTPAHRVRTRRPDPHPAPPRRQASAGVPPLKPTGHGGTGVRSGCWRLRSVGELPALPDTGRQLLARLAPALRGDGADDFVASPTLDGRPAETTPFSRELDRRGLVAALAEQSGNGLLPRLAALLAELARGCAVLGDAPRDARPGDPAAADEGLLAGQASEGIGAAAAARGLLVHRAALASGSDLPNIGDYRILAPTEWNFHSEGGVAAALGGLIADRGLSDEQLLARARLLVTAVDPCVDYSLDLA